MNSLMSEYKDWGRTVKKALIDRDMTIAELSKSLCISKWTVYGVTCGKRLNYKVAKCISEYLGIPAP